MILDEAILHAEERAQESSCSECAKEHKQLAEWLKELKTYRQRFGEIHDISDISEPLEMSSESLQRLDELFSEELEVYKNAQAKRKAELK